MTNSWSSLGTVGSTCICSRTSRVTGELISQVNEISCESQSLRAAPGRPTKPQGQVRPRRVGPLCSHWGPASPTTAPAQRVGITVHFSLAFLPSRRRGACVTIVTFVTDKRSGRLVVWAPGRKAKRVRVVDGACRSASARLLHASAQVASLSKRCRGGCRSRSGPWASHHAAHRLADY